MKLQIKINLDNSAFEFQNGDEMSAILKELAVHLEGSHLTDGFSKVLYDCNGNRVGKAEILPE